MRDSCDLQNKKLSAMTTNNSLAFQILSHKNACELKRGGFKMFR